MKRARLVGGNQRGETNRRGQSSIIGLTLLFGLVALGAGVVILAGSTAIADTQQHSEIQRATHTMTLLDSRSAMVALGDAEGQMIDVTSEGGQYSVNEETGWLRISHHNFSGNGNKETVLNVTLGSVAYENGDTTIAYQGGGVWRLDPGGGSSMLSPPEFHYRDATLTLPVIRVDRDEAGGSSSMIAVKPESRARHVYPNVTGPSAGDEIGAPYNVTNGEYTNPVRNGTVNITVHSRYYLGWAEYFNTRTQGDIEIFNHNNTVRLELETTAVPIGAFDMPLEGNALDIESIDNGHPLNSFHITLKPDGHYANMHWGFYVDNGNEGFEIHFHSSNPGKCQGGSYNGELRLSVYYFNTSGGVNYREEWGNSSIDPNTNPNFEISCPSGTLEAEFLSSTTMEYQEIESMPGVSGSSNKWYWGAQIKGDSITDPTRTFDMHTADTGQYSPGQTEDLSFIVDHYMGLLSPDYEMTVTDGPGGSSRVDEGESFGELTYDIISGPQYLRYLHVTENEIVVDAG